MHTQIRRAAHAHADNRRRARLATSLQHTINHKGLDDVYRTIDSRLDKLVTKLNPVTKDLLQD